jgi:ligand-binding sensor domain-containing protein/signal transduction histidine kinase
MLVLSWICLVLARLVAEAAATTGPGEYLFESWQAKDGLPSSIAAIAQTPDGYLWVATVRGLARFDGNRFVIIDAENTPILQAGRMQDLHVDRAGRLWVANSFGRLCVLEAGQFIATNDEQTPIGMVDSFVEWPDGRLWVVCSAGLRELRGDRWYELALSKSAAGDAHWRMRLDDQGIQWINASGALLRVLGFGGVPTRVSEIQPLGMAPARGGGLWLSTGPTIRRLRANGTLAFEVQVPWKSPGWRVELLEDHHGQLWLGSAADGLWRVRQQPDGSMKVEQVALAGTAVRALFEDRQGNLWVGTDGAGLWRIRSRFAFAFSPGNTPGPQIIHSVAPDHAGGVWFAAAPGGIYQIPTADKGQSLISRFPAFLPADPWSVHEDQQRRLWVGTYGNGLFCFDAITGRLLKSFRDLQLNYALVMHEDSDGSMWFGTPYGLVRLTDQQRIVFGRTEGLWHQDVRALARDTGGNLWVGTFDGLCRYAKGRFDRFTITNGLPHPTIECLLPTEDGALWIGTRGGGLAHWQNGRFTTCGEADGLPDKFILEIAADRQDNLWLATTRGIVRVRRRELEDFMLGGNRPPQFLTLDESDGLPGRETSDNTQPGSCRTSDGRLWFAMTAGVGMLDPAVFPRDQTPPPVVIEQVVQGDRIVWSRLQREAGTNAPANLRPGRTPALPASVLLNPGTERVEIRCTALDLRSPARLRFRFKLEGLDQDWEAAGTRRTAYFNRLRPGSYIFRVQAANGDGVWNEAGASLAIIKRPFVWETRAFATLCLAAIALASALAARKFFLARARRRIERLEHLGALQNERARIARDMHDHLGADLTHVTLMTEMLERQVAPTGPVLAQVRRIGGKVRELVRHMDEIVWATNPAKDNLNATIQYIAACAEELFAESETALRLDYPPDLPATPLSSEVRHHLFLAVKEAFNNALKHGGATAVEFLVRQEGGTLRLSVRDNGEGFDPGCNSTGRNGLANIRKRMESVGGHLRLTSAPGKGTRVDFELPIN